MDAEPSAGDEKVGFDHVFRKLSMENWRCRDEGNVEGDLVIACSSDRDEPGDHRKPSLLSSFRSPRIGKIVEPPIVVLEQHLRVVCQD